MKKHIPFLVLVIIVLAIFIFNSRSGIDTNTQYPSVNTDTQNSGVNIDVQWSPAPISEITWNTYASQEMGISFEYPKEWSVELGTGTLRELLLIIPPDNEIMAREIHGSNNFIMFLSKDRLLHPRYEPLNVIELDEREWFSGFQEYIADSTLAEGQEIRVSRENLPIGIYRKGDRMVGMRQGLCGRSPAKSRQEAKEQSAQCHAFFNYILNSIQFIE